MTREPFVRCDNVFKIYKIANLEVVALQGLTLEMARGDMIALIGPSGAGKSTLLNIIGGLDRPSAGKVTVGGWELDRIDESDRVHYKRDMVGFVWQQPSRNLLPYLTARQNVELPMMHSGVAAARRKKRALELLELLGLADRAGFAPDRLSGGEQQRVALAVALANGPDLVLGDELTGQVDSASAKQVFDALLTINREFGTSAIVVTHDPAIAARLGRVITIRDGRTSTEIHRQTVGETGLSAEREWIILDPVGRMQLPRTYVNTLEMKELVRLHLEPDHVSIWPREVAQKHVAADRTVTRLREEELESPVDGKEQLAGRVEAKGVPVVLDHLSRSFEVPGGTITALQDICLEIPAGSLSAIKGPSGSGKTTLLNIIATLDEPTSGTVAIGEEISSDLQLQQKIALCREQIGYVFQTFALLPFLTAEENVQVPLRLLQVSPEERDRRVAQALRAVGLSKRAAHRTHELSGGEQQRVAIARALVKRPKLILADEPTGQLDSLTGASIITLLRHISIEQGITVVVASHDPNVHEAADWVFELHDGRLVDSIRWA